MVQVEPFSQAGHDGADVSHLTQRLKMERAVMALGEKEASKDMMMMMRKIYNKDDMNNRRKSLKAERMAADQRAGRKNECS